MRNKRSARWAVAPIEHADRWFESNCHHHTEVLENQGLPLFLSAYHTSVVDVNSSLPPTKPCKIGVAQLVESGWLRCRKIAWLRCWFVWLDCWKKKRTNYNPSVLSDPNFLASSASVVSCIIFLSFSTGEISGCSGIRPTGNPSVRNAMTRKPEAGCDAASGMTFYAV